MKELIQKSEKMVSLLKEYEASKKYERCLYHVVNQPDRDGWFFLIEIKSGEIKRDGTPDKIKSFLRLRKIDGLVVFDYEKLNT